MWLSLVITLTTALLQCHGQCGVVQSNIKDTFIVGGQDAVEGAWPWQLALEYFDKQTQSWEHACGASLIDELHAVTAGHCYNPLGEPYRIVAGQYDRSTTSGHEQYRDVVRFTLHPDFVLEEPYPNDIAILEFASAVDLSSSYVNPVCLPPQGADHTGNDQCYITGWGYLSGSVPEVPNILQEAHIDVITMADCQAYWGSSVLPGHVCGHDSTSSAISACNGDSGGPLVCMVNQRYELVGTTSWIFDGCVSFYPSVFTRTEHYLDFIESETSNPNKRQMIPKN